MALRHPRNALYAPTNILRPTDAPTSTKRQPARTGRRSPGAFGSIPGGGASLGDLRLDPRVQPELACRDPVTLIAELSPARSKLDMSEPRACQAETAPLLIFRSNKISHCRLQFAILAVADRTTNTHDDLSDHDVASDPNSDGRRPDRQSVSLASKHWRYRLWLSQVRPSEKCRDGSEQPWTVRTLLLLVGKLNS